MAAGRGERFGKKKQFLDFGKTTVLNTSVVLFMNIEEVNQIIIVYPPDMDKKEVIKKGKLCGDLTMVKGGKKREESVMNGLKHVQEEFVLIHDAVRPCCSKRLIKEVLKTTLEQGNAVPGINPFSTVVFFREGEYKLLDRSKVFNIQTPQGYRTSEIIKAYKNRKDFGYTDSSSVAYDYGIKIIIVKGERNNKKITLQEDYEFLKGIYK